VKLVALDGDARFPRDQRAAAVDAFRDRRLEHDARGRAAAARACFTALNGRIADGKRICDFAHLGQTRPAGERETGVAQGVAGGIDKELARELGRRHPFSTDIPARSTGWGLVAGPCQAASAAPTSEDSGVIDQSNRGFPEGVFGAARCDTKSFVSPGSRVCASSACRKKPLRRWVGPGDSGWAPNACARSLSVLSCAFRGRRLSLNHLYRVPSHRHLPCAAAQMTAPHSRSASLISVPFALFGSHLRHVAMKFLLQKVISRRGHENQSSAPKDAFCDLQAHSLQAECERRASLRPSALRNCAPAGPVTPSGFTRMSDPYRISAIRSPAATLSGPVEGSAIAGVPLH